MGSHQKMYTYLSVRLKKGKGKNVKKYVIRANISQHAYSQASLTIGYTFFDDFPESLPKVKL